MVERESAFEAAAVRTAAEHLLGDVGLAPDVAHEVVAHMMLADRRGRVSHGLAVRLPMILEHARAGRGRGVPEIAQDDGHAVRIDGHDAFGYYAAAVATDALIDRARARGMAVVSLCNTRHTGMLGAYAARAAARDVVALVFANCSPLMAPAGGSRRLLGTNPVAFGFPAAPSPIVIDMATSAISYGDVLRHAASGTPLPAGVAVDADGEPTTDAGAARAGAVLPFGGHRGGALAVAVQLLSGVVTGGTAIPPPGTEYGMLLIGIAAGAFGDRASYDESIEAFCNAYLAIPPLAGESVRIPGAGRWADEPVPAEVVVPDALAAELGLAG
jgi:LDH2 family malate/lactate/ureidoglycolate dehydrogenase